MMDQKFRLGYSCYSRNNPSVIVSALHEVSDYWNSDKYHPVESKYYRDWMKELLNNNPITPSASVIDAVFMLNGFI